MPARIFFIILGLLTLVQIVIRIARKLLHFPAPAYVGPLLDSDYRRFFQPPRLIIARSGIKKGMRVLEVGCGSGAYTTFVARAVGNKGKVYALDIQPAMLAQLEKKLSRPENRDIKNIKLIPGSAYKLPFANNTLDLVYLITVLQEIPNRRKAIEEAKRVLKNGGILAVTEFLPDPDYPLQSTTINLLTKAGFILDKASGNFWHYTVRAKKS